MIKDFRSRFEQDPNVFSYRLCHIAVGRRDNAQYLPEYPDFRASPASWHPKWKRVHLDLTNVSVLSLSSKRC